MCMFTFYVDLLRGLFKTVRNELQNVCYAPILFQPRTNFVLYTYTLLDVYLHIPTQVHCVQPASMFFWTLRNCDAVSIARRAWNSLSAVNRKRIIILFLRLFLFKYLCQVSSKNPLQMRGLELEQREDLQMTLHVRIKISVYINVGRGQWKGIKPCYGIVF